LVVLKISLRRAGAARSWEKERHSSSDYWGNTPKPSGCELDGSGTWLAAFNNLTDAGSYQARVWEKATIESTRCRAGGQLHSSTQSMVVQSARIACFRGNSILFPSSGGSKFSNII